MSFTKLQSSRGDTLRLGSSDIANLEDDLLDVDWMFFDRGIGSGTKKPEEKDQPKSVDEILDRVFAILDNLDQTAHDRDKMQQEQEACEGT